MEALDKLLFALLYYKRDDGYAREHDCRLGIDSADIGARYEVACKHLLSEKAIPARIMKECLEEFRDVLLAANIQPEAKKNVLEDEFSIPISRSFEQEVSGMCNLSKGVLERGRREGIKEGIKENRIQSIKNLMETLSLSFDQTVEALKIPVSERDEHARLLGK